MKKILISLIFIFVAIFSFSQANPAYILNINGNDWISLTKDTQVGMVMGIFMVQELNTNFAEILFSENKITSKQRDEILNFNAANYLVSAAGTVNAINFYYANKYTMDTPLWKIILIVMGVFQEGLNIPKVPNQTQS